MPFTKIEAAQILQDFGMVENADPKLVSIIRHTNPLPHNDLYLLTYGKHRYMILQDDTAAGQLEYVRHNFEQAVLIPSSGHVVENPVEQPDGERYATGYDGHEYYLWSYDKDE